MPEGFKNVGEAIAASPEVAAANHDDSAAPFGGQEEPDVVILDEEDRDKAKPFRNKTVLVVDDDHRNIFALKNALKHEGMEILTAENGYECLELLEKGNDIDVILMDIMMPGMDGYETMTRIREQSKFEELPIIALTAKAMKGDREKCLKAGASDYVSKPLKLDQLLSVLRVWLTN
jgi:two-component system chemotaxis sensor kinase CheA